MTWSALNSTVSVRAGAVAVVGLTWGATVGCTWDAAVAGAAAIIGSADHQTNFVRNARPSRPSQIPTGSSLSHRMSAATIARSVALPTQVWHPKGPPERSPFDRIILDEDWFRRPPARGRLCSGACRRGQGPGPFGKPRGLSAIGFRRARSSAL